MNFRLLAEAKARCRFSQHTNYTAADGLEEVGQRTGLGLLGIGLRERGQRLRSGPDCRRSLGFPLWMGKAVNLAQIPGAKAIIAKTHSGGYKTGLRAKTRHFGSIDNSVQGGGWGRG